MHSNKMRNIERNIKRNERRTMLSNKSLPQPCVNRVRLILLRRGLTYAEVARQLGVSNRSSIARVVYGHYRVPEIREGIAKLVNMPVEALWPERHAS